MIRLETSNFKGSLLDLIGQDVDQIKNSYPGYRIVNENAMAGRFIWREDATDTENQKRLALLYMARFLEGKIWAVGIWSEDYLFGIASEEGEFWFNAGPKPPEAGRDSVNWIVKEGGKLVEKGFAP